jgi:hypothetical protein
MRKLVWIPLFGLFIGVILCERDEQWFHEYAVWNATYHAIVVCMILFLKLV